MDEMLTLDKVKKLVRQREAVKEQQLFFKKDESTLDYVKQKPPGPRQTKDRVPFCSKCGKIHARQTCPARDVTCFKCNRRGHFSKMCFSKTVAMLSEDRFNAEKDTSTETSHQYLDAISDQSLRPATAWHIRAIVNNTEVVFKIDTGAEVTAISKKVYVGNPTKILCGPSRHPLDVWGCITVQLRYKQHTIRHHMYVVKTLNQNLLGLPAITALNILTKVDALSNTTSSIPAQFPDLFQGLETMKAKYEIKLKPDAKPYALFSACRIPIPLRSKVEQELKQMETTRVISKTDQLTDWCAGMVVVQEEFVYVLILNH